jgi:hypothetical protein
LLWGARPGFICPGGDAAPQPDDFHIVHRTIHVKSIVALHHPHFDRPLTGK